MLNTAEKSRSLIFYQSADMIDLLI